MKGKYLITTDCWFYAPDGKKYRAVWGEVEIIEDSFLGVKTNRNSTNWFARVGGEEKSVLVAGCQIHYAVKSEKAPNVDYVKDVCYGDGKKEEFVRPTEIYIAE